MRNISLTGHSATKRTKRVLLVACLTAGLLASGPTAPPAHGATAWWDAAADYLNDNRLIPRDSFRPNEPMKREVFKNLMDKAFGGGYERTRGKVTAGEVDYALVRALGYEGLARELFLMRSPDGWDPDLHEWFGSEIVARHLGLRRNRDTTEEVYESSAREAMLQADIAWAVWQAKTSPNTWSLTDLSNFRLPNLSRTKRKVFEWAFSLVGKPYVWAGEWATKTPAGYPYGAQSQGGFDCSGFAWYVLRSADPGWDPPNRPYSGWSLPERSSSQMAAAASPRISFSNLKKGDLLLFAPYGPSSSASSVYHAGIYLGRGWMVHSSNGTAGVSMDKITSGYWRENFAWGRRII